MAHQLTLSPHHDDFASSSTVSGSVSTPYVHYDVFISHCGRDLDASTFARTLCSRLISRELHVFLDKLEYMFEEEVTSQMQAAISLASVQIAIFSQNYAQWKWCLDALVHMTKSEATILPVFYKVKPSDVRWTGKDKNGPYAQWVRDHEEKERYDSQIIQNWRDILFHVSEISGFELEACNGDDEELLSKVVESVFKFCPHPHYDVFMSHRGPDTKKTFAGPLYDRIISRGLRVFLDKPELVEGLRIASQIEVAIQSASVHIAIFSPNFAQSSWCLDELFLMTKSKATILPVFYELKPSDLNGVYAEALLHHRQKRLYDYETIQRWSGALADVPKSNDFVLDGNKEELMDKIVQSVLDYIPKPSEEMQSSEVVQNLMKCVFNENVLKLSEVVEQSPDRAPVEEIKDPAKFLYDSLFHREQQIFLDIACFFIGKDRDTAIRIWGIAGLKLLENRCLLHVRNNKIEMIGHRNYGRYIANQLMPCRLWDQGTKEIDDLLEKSSSELAQFRGITMIPPVHFLDLSDETEMSCHKQSHEMFHGPRNLKFVAAQGRYVEDILTRVGSPDLIWLNWYKCTYSYLPSWIPMENLSVLEVAGSKLTELWRPESQAPLQLRELNIFAPLSMFPQSIGQLEHLEKIVVKYFDDRPLPFTALPQEFCHLRSLNYLELRNCSIMTSLPDSFGELTNLEYIDLKGASRLKMLPNSFGNLTLLKYLYLEECSEIQELPGLEHLTSLKRLDVWGCKKLQSIPGLGQLTKLQTLKVGGRTETLNAGGCAEIQELFGVEHLTSLEVLSVWECKKLQSMPALGLLTKLVRLYARGCSEIQELPGLEHLISLEWLGVWGCKKLQNIPGLGQLTKLQTLNIGGCAEIQELLGVEHLTSLKMLNVWECKKLQSMPALGLLTKLLTLDVRGCSEIQELPGVEHLTSLETLNGRDCKKLQSIPGLGQLTKLQTLDVSGCSEIQSLPGLEHLTSLETLDVWGCKKLQSIPGLGQLTKLQTLNVGGCKKMKSMPALGQLTKLQTLNVGGWKKMKSIQALGLLTKLRILNVSECCEIRELPGVEHLTSLEVLVVRDCKKFESMPRLGQLKYLQRLDVGGWSEIQTLSGLEHSTSLETLDVWGCQKLRSIPALGLLTKLRKLYVCECCEIRELPSVEHLSSSEALTVRHAGCPEIQELPGVGYVMSLEVLEVRRCPKVHWGKGVRGQRLKGGLRVSTQVVQVARFGVCRCLGIVS